MKYNRKIFTYFCLIAILAGSIPAQLSAQGREAAREANNDAEKGFAGRVQPEANPPQRIAVEPNSPNQADIWTGRSSYWPNDNVQIYFKTSFDSYVYIFNKDTEGNVYQIFPNYYDRDNFCRANRTYVIPDDSYKLRVTGPQGYESLQLIAYPRRYQFFNAFHEFKATNPFPSRSRGVEELKDLFKRNIEENGPAARPAEPARRNGPEAQRIVVTPNPPAPQPLVFAEAWTRFYVRGFYNTPPAPPQPGPRPRAPRRTS